MSAQATSDRPPETGPSFAALRPDAATAINLLSEQGAVPIDQMARFLGYDHSIAADLLEDLEEDGWLKTGSFLTAEPPWAWLSRRGVRGAPRNFCFLQPRLLGLAHRRAVNEVRLHLRERAPHGHWVCERALRRRLEPKVPIPDGVFEIDGERHALEIELSPKSTARWRSIIASHSNRYDAVIYFCGPRTRQRLQRLQRREAWPKLTIRRVPGTSVPLAAPTHRSSQSDCRRSDTLDLAPWERRVSRLISEQGAIPIDQLAAFLDRDISVAAALARRLSDRGLADVGKVLDGDTNWIWLTDAGSRVSESGLRGYLPSASSLERARANNAVRLQTEAREPGARWINWRALRGQITGPRLTPQAVVEIGVERHAIELDTGRRQKRMIVPKIARLGAEYDAVVLFCTPRRLRMYASLQIENHWPKLLIRRLPDPFACVPLSPSPWTEDFAHPDYGNQRCEEIDLPPELDDELWEEISALLSADGRSARPSKRRRFSDRQVVCGIIYIARNGGGWNRLPQRFGLPSGITCNVRLRRWARLGIWPAVQDLLESKLPDGEQITWSSLDSRSVQFGR